VPNFYPAPVTFREAQKPVPVATFDWAALVQFSGLAKTKQNFDTSKWLSSLSSLDNMHAPVKWLEEKLLEAGSRHIGLSHCHTFSVAGFERAHIPREQLGKA
jgi:hypothetical protein